MFNGSKIKIAVSTGLAAAGLGIAALAEILRVENAASSDEEQGTGN